MLENPTSRQINRANRGMPLASGALVEIPINDDQPLCESIRIVRVSVDDGVVLAS